MARMSKWVPTTNLMELRRLGKLGEELGELQAVAARCVIQGIDEIDPGTGKVNRLRLQDELADVQAQIDCTLEAFGLDLDYHHQRALRKAHQMGEWEALFGHPPTPVVCGNCDTAVPPGCNGVFKDDGSACALNRAAGVGGDVHQTQGGSR